MAVQRNKRQEKMNLDEFFALLESDPENRYELIDGYPLMMTGRSPDHAIIGANLNSLLGAPLRKRPCIVYNSGVYIQLDGEENCLCPDASVSCDRRDRHATKTIRYPCVVAEVLSPGTRARDKGMKVDLYQNMPSIQEILFIDTAIMRVQLYRREIDYWIMRNFTNDDRVELASPGVSFSVRKVYEKTTFDQAFAEE